MKTLFTSFLAVVMFGSVMAQTQNDSIEKEEVALQEVFVSAIRADKKMAVTFTNVKAAEIAPKNLGQDLPILLNYLPGVVTTSDAGAGIGYTGIRVRGSDATRVNVTINGVPYNDAESQGTYWVDLPDFATSVESLQLQRGVGTSSNGAGAFGASLNLNTNGVSEAFSGMVKSSVGSFNTFNNSVSFNSGILGSHFSLSGRLSKITSDGYVDRASSNLKSYFLQGDFQDKNTQLKALVFGGHERTYQAWYGVDSYTLATDRTYNWAGYYLDEQGNEKFYQDQVDDYLQNHAQLLWHQKLGNSWTSNIAIHFTHGEGYYEEYNENGEDDTVTRKWLDNNFYGGIYAFEKVEGDSKIIIGGGLNRYDGNHFGTYVWGQNSAVYNFASRFYDYQSLKTDFNNYLKYQKDWNSQLSSYVDLQYRRVHYDTEVETGASIDDVFHFFNPKAGLTYALDLHNSVYLSYAKAHREPNRTDYENGNPKPESLDDYELGWRYLTSNHALNVNVFYMNYKDQLVLTGALNPVGSPIRENIGSSYRLGIELDGQFQLTNRLSWMPNVSVSKHRNKNFYFQKDGVVTNFGDTHIAYSPELIIGNRVAYSLNKAAKISLMTKHVGSQYMGNIDSENSTLEAYMVSDLNMTYEIPNTLGLEIQVAALVNNLFDTRYTSNGYFYTYDDTWSNPEVITTIEGAGYYPQAGRNFLVGVSIGW